MEDEMVFSQNDPRVIRDAAIKRERVQTWLRERGLDGVIISRRDHFAWITCGGDNHVLKNSDIGVGHLVITPQKCYLVAHSMDALRLFEEQVPGQGYELVSLHWYHGDPRLAARDLIGERWAADTPYEGAVEVNRDLSLLHDPLTELELARCRWLGQQVGDILCEIAQSLRPGQSEEEVARNLHVECIKRGIELDVLIVGSDERIFRYRHPLPTDKKIERYVLLHPAARRWGLHANVSRSVYFGKPPGNVERAYRAAATLEAHLLDRLVPGLSFAEILEWQKSQYAELGFVDEWRHHFQGGPTGYVVVDALRHSTAAKVQVNQAFDWFITITGAKVEELVLLSKRGIEIPSFQAPWPVFEPEGGIPVPDLWVR
jgi:antitoxin VapB